MRPWLATLSIVIVGLILLAGGAYFLAGSDDDAGDGTGRLQAAEGPGTASSTTAAALELPAIAADLDRIVPAGDGRGMNVALRSADPDLALALGQLEPSPVRLGADGRLLPAQPAVLDGAVELLQRHPAATVEVVGYAVAETAALSHDRSHAVADAVAAYLVDRGIGPSRLATIGMGDEPLAQLPAGPLIVPVGGDVVTVEFGTDGTLTPAGQRAVDELAALLTLDPDTVVELAVYAHAAGDSDANHDLSHRHGDAIVAAMAATGIDPGRLVVVGRGDADEVDDREGSTYVRVSRRD